MGKSIFDFENGVFAFRTSDNTAMNTDGDMIVRMSDNMGMNMNSGEIHITSSWRDDDEDDD